ncbi:MAG: hypothetical protein JW874_10380 [Spirochaetales bacterium]|nr:hypothetical protein [Spirochaetales bacterium]
MIRFEIITNRSVERDIIDLLLIACPELCYTLIPGVLGKGRQGIRNSDPVWPEENSIIVIYTDSAKEDRIISGVLAAVKERFPKEGIKVFKIPVIPG